MKRIKSELTHKQDISITHDPPLRKTIDRIKRNLRKTKKQRDTSLHDTRYYDSEELEKMMRGRPEK